MMTVLECLQQFRESAEPILARNKRISLAVEAEGLECLDGTDAGRRRLSMDEAERVAAEMDGWTPERFMENCESGAPVQEQAPAATAANDGTQLINALLSMMK